jgi:hypothetical protein
MKGSLMTTANPAKADSTTTAKRAVKKAAPAETSAQPERRSEDKRVAALEARVAALELATGTDQHRPV